MIVKSSRWLVASSSILYAVCCILGVRGIMIAGLQVRRLLWPQSPAPRGRKSPVSEVRLQAGLGPRQPRRPRAAAGEGEERAARALPRHRGQHHRRPGPG